MSLRTLVLAAGTIGVAFVLATHEHPEWGLFVILPFAVGLIWAEIGPFRDGTAALIAMTSPLVAALVVYVTLVVWELVLRGNQNHPLGRALLFLPGILLSGFVPSVAGGLLGCSLMRRATHGHAPATQDSANAQLNARDVDDRNNG